jgi:hypothetical protein
VCKYTPNTYVELESLDSLKNSIIIDITPHLIGITESLPDRIKFHLDLIQKLNIIHRQKTK